VIIALEQATHKADVAGTGLRDNPECLSEQLSNRFVGLKRQGGTSTVVPQTVYLPGEAANAWRDIRTGHIEARSCL